MTMTREEEIQEAAEHYEQVDATNLACDYGWGDRDIQQQCFKAGVEWADQHPREGLWDSNKVLAWISQNIESYCKLNAKNFNNLLFDLGKAMED